MIKVFQKYFTWFSRTCSRQFTSYVIPDKDVFGVLSAQENGGVAIDLKIITPLMKAILRVITARNACHCCQYDTDALVALQVEGATDQEIELMNPSRRSVRPENQSTQGRQNKRKKSTMGIGGRKIRYGFEVKSNMKAQVALLLSASERHALSLIQTENINDSTSFESDEYPSSLQLSAPPSSSSLSATVDPTATSSKVLSSRSAAKPRSKSVKHDLLDKSTSTVPFFVSMHKCNDSDDNMYVFFFSLPNADDMLSCVSVSDSKRIIVLNGTYNPRHVLPSYLSESLCCQAEGTVVQHMSKCYRGFVRASIPIPEDADAQSVSYHQSLHCHRVFHLSLGCRSFCALNVI